MYAAFVTMKDQKVYGDGIDIMSITPDGYEVPFDSKYPDLQITYNHIGSLTHPEYKTVIVKLSDVWLIGKSYWYPAGEKDLYYYEDNTGVNHPNAIKALQKQKEVPS